MGTTKADILSWLQWGKSQGQTHVIVACDTFDHTDYPVYVAKDQKVREEYERINKSSMQKVMEVYALHLPFEDQLNEHRSFHFEELDTGMSSNR